MKAIFIYFYFITVLSFAQNPKIHLRAIEDASNLTSNFKTLYRNDEFLIDQYDDSLVYKTDTNYIIIKGESCTIKDTIGKTKITLVNTKTREVIDEKTILIKNRPKNIIAQIDEKLLRSKQILKIKIVDEKGKDCSKKYTLGFFEYQLINKDDKQFFMTITSNQMSTINNVDFSNATKINATYLIICKENGLSLRTKVLEEILD